MSSSRQAKRRKAKARINTLILREAEKAAKEYDIRNERRIDQEEEMIRRQESQGGGSSIGRPYLTPAKTFYDEINSPSNSSYNIN